MILVRLGNANVLKVNNSLRINTDNAAGFSLEPLYHYKETKTGDRCSLDQFGQHPENNGTAMNTTKLANIQAFVPGKITKDQAERQHLKRT